MWYAYQKTKKIQFSEITGEMTGFSLTNGIILNKRSQKQLHGTLLIYTKKTKSFTSFSKAPLSFSLTAQQIHRYPQAIVEASGNGTRCWLKGYIRDWSPHQRGCICDFLQCLFHWEVLEPQSSLRQEHGLQEGLLGGQHGAEDRWTELAAARPTQVSRIRWGHYRKVVMRI